MALKFDFKKDYSPIFGEIARPVAQVFLKHSKLNKWRPVTMIVDTGADYTLLPRWYAPALGVSLKKDCKLYTAGGIGGKERVYLYRRPLKARIGNWQRGIPVGFLDRDNIPPLMGRKDFLETFATLFFSNKTTFAISPKEL